MNINPHKYEIPIFKRIIKFFIFQKETIYVKFVLIVKIGKVNW